MPETPVSIIAGSHSPTQIYTEANARLHYLHNRYKKKDGSQHAVQEMALPVNIRITLIKSKTNFVAVRNGNAIVQLCRPRLRSKNEATITMLPNFNSNKLTLSGMILPLEKSNVFKGVTF